METKKKFNKKLWIPVITAVVLLGAATGICAATGLFDPKEEEPIADDQLYWNTDRKNYVGKSADGSTVRPVNKDDNMYHISYAMESGRASERRIKDKETVQLLDQFDVVGLVTDEKGIVTGYRDINEFTGGLAINRMTFIRKDGNKYLCNAAVDQDGLEFTFEIPDSAKFFDVSGTGLEMGSFITGDDLKTGDVISAVKNKEDVITHVYLAKRDVPAEVYWNVERKWDSTKKETTREPNTKGEYEFLMAYQGEQITVKTQNKTIAEEMDGYNARCMGLTFDDNGYVIKTKNTKACTGGGSFGSWYVVTNIEDGEITVKQDSTGTVLTKKVASLWEVYNVSGIYDPDGYEGEVGELQVGDKQHSLTNSNGQIVLTYIVGNRKADSELYWNITRMYDSVKKETTRVPDSQGRYLFEVYVDSVKRTLWTKDKKIAGDIDSQGAQCFGGILNGDEIVKFYKPGLVSGGSAWAAWDVTSFDGKTVKLLKDPLSTSTDAGKTKDLVLSSEARIYDMSTDAKPTGKKMTGFQAGDRINMLTDKNGELLYAFITKHLYDSEVYFNVTRRYNSTTKESTRKLDADGTYHIDLLVNGQVKTYRVKEKSLIDELDAYSIRAFGLQVDGDIITRSFPVTSVKKTAGGNQGAMYFARSIQNGVIHLVENGSGKSVDVPIGENCEIYNTGIVDSYVGERTTVQVGDKLLCLVGADKKAKIIFVVEREHKHVCEDCGKEEIFTMLTGSITKNGTYHVCLGSDMYLSGGINIGSDEETGNDVHVTLDLNGHMLRAADGLRALTVVGKNCSLTIVDCKGTGRIVGSGDIAAGARSSLGALIYARAGSLTIYKGIIDASATESPASRIQDDGSIKNYNNSAVYVAGGAKFTMLGGQINGTKSTYRGGCIFMASDSEVTLKNVKLQGGEATDAGGNIYVTKSAKLNLDGNVQVTGGKLSDGTDNNLFLPSGAMINITKKLQGEIGLTASKGVFTNDDVADAKSAFKPDPEGGEIQVNGDGALMFDLTLASVSFKTGSTQLNIADYVSLSAVVKPAALQNEVKLVYESSDPSKLSIDENGMIVGLASTGDDDVTVKVTATLEGEPPVEKTATCKVKVKPEIATGHVHDLNGHGVKVKFTEWHSTDVLPSKSGYFYLSNDVALSDTYTTEANQHIYLCLNGHTVTAPLNKRAVETQNNGSTLAICDCSAENQGAIVGNGSPNGFGGLIYIRNEFSLYGGTLKDGTALYADSTADVGGNLFINAVGTFNMYGGRIKNGQAKRNAGNLYVAGAFNMYGGQITEGSLVSSSGHGKDVMVSGTSASIKLSGKPYIGDICLNGVQMSVAAYEGPDSAFGSNLVTTVSLGTTYGVFTSDAAPQGIEDYLESLYTAVSIRRNADNKLELFADNHRHCICGGNCDAVKSEGAAAGTHTCEEVKFTAISDVASLKTAFANGGTYYLLGDMDLKNDGALIVGEGKTVSLCLNGHRIYTSGKINALNLSKAGSVLNLSDCSEGMKGNVGPKTLEISQKTVVNIASQATLNLYGGTIQNGVSKTVSGGNINVNANGLLQIFGGVVKNGSAGDSSNTSIDGGNICIKANGNMKMYGGVIEDGTGYRNGGNIWCAGIVEIAGGRIQGGTAETSYGGNVFLSGASIFRMTGGLMEGGKRGDSATHTASNMRIYSDTASVYISGGTVKGCVDANKFGKFYITGDAVISDDTNKYGITIPSGKAGTSAIRIAKEDGTYQALSEGAKICVLPNAALDKQVILYGGKSEDLTKVKAGAGGTLSVDSDGIVYNK